MTIEIRSNGRTELRLQPQRPLEGMALGLMADAAAKGATVTLQREEKSNVFIVSVETEARA